MPRIMPVLNWALLGLSGLALLWRFYVMVKPFPVYARDTIRGVLIAPVTMGVYALILGAWFILPLGAYLLLGGAALGLALGVLTRVKVEGGVATGKRAPLYMVIWGLTLLLTQWLGTAVGDAGVAAGLTLMLFPMAMGAAQDLLVLSRAKKAVARSGRPASGGVAVAALLLAVGLIAANVLFPVGRAYAAITWPADDWGQAAAREYNKGNYQLALDLASVSAMYYGDYLYRGEAKAQSQLVASLACDKLGNGQAASWRAAAEATLRKRFGAGSPEPALSDLVTSTLERLATLIARTPPGNYTLRTNDVAYVQGLGACYRQDIPELWARYGHLIEKYMDIPWVAALFGSTWPLVRAMAESQPVTPERAAAAGVVVPAILAGSTVLDLRALGELARRRKELGLSGGKAPGAADGKPVDTQRGRPGTRAADVAGVELARLGGTLHSHLARAVEAGADLPISLTQWNPDRPSWLDLIRRAVEKFIEYEDQIEAAQEVKELVQEATQSDELALLALSRLAAAARHLRDKGLLGDHPLVTKLDEMAGKLGPNGVKAVLAAADAAGQDLPEVTAAMIDSFRSLAGE